jgi:Protein of unknown function (DUF2809)
VRQRLVVALTVIAPLGIATKFYRGPGEGWVGAHAGGVLYVVFWSLLILALRPRLSPWVVGGAVLTVTSALEVAQLWHPRPLEAVRATFVGHALLGSTFAWSDFPHYAAGLLLAVWIARAAGHRSRSVSRTSARCGRPHPPSSPGTPR